MNQYYIDLIERIHDNLIELKADFDLSNSEIISILPSMEKRIDSCLWDITEFKQGDDDFENEYYDN